MIIEVVGKEIEKIKGDFESYLNGLNMVGEISYSQYSELYDEGTKQIQKAYELGKSELEQENAELKESYCLRRCKHCEFLHENGNCLKVGGYFTAVDNKYCPLMKDKVDLIKENAELKKINADGLSELNHTNGDLIIENEKLKKENAELRKDKKELCHSISEGGKACVYLNEQLTKAREIIKKMLYVSCNSDVLVQYPNCSEVLQSRVEAENFLKESEVEK